MSSASRGGPSPEEIGQLNRVFIFGLIGFISVLALIAYLTRRICGGTPISGPVMHGENHFFHIENVKLSTKEICQKLIDSKKVLKSEDFVALKSDIEEGRSSDDRTSDTGSDLPRFIRLNLENQGTASNTINKKSKSNYRGGKHNILTHPKDNDSLQRDEEIKISKEEDVPNCCSICLANYNVGDTVAWSKNSKCHHVFHHDCIVHWLRVDLTCPYCRRDFLEDEWNAHGSCTSASR